MKKNILLLFISTQLLSLPIGYAITERSKLADIEYFNDDQLNQMSEEPVLQAAEVGNFDVFNYLINERKRDHQAQDTLGNTALHRVVNLKCIDSEQTDLHSRLKIIEFLKSLGFDFSHKNNLGKTAADIANQKSQMQVSGSQNSPNNRCLQENTLENHYKALHKALAIPNQNLQTTPNKLTYGLVGAAGLAALWYAIKHRN